jgi:ATPase components of ABC transporters with duplicated ATPase domains
VVERFRYKANKAAMAQAKLAQIRRIGTVDDPSRYDTRTFRTSFNPAEQTTEKTLVMDKLTFGYDVPLGTVSIIVTKGDKVGIIGANGCGKSTLIHTLMRGIPALSGTANFGVQTKIGYFDQTLTQASSEDSVLDSFREEFPSLTDTEVRTALGSFMFSGNDVFKKVCDLSGGEKVRLALCRILKHCPNVLILDEPTNHMDIVGKESFESLLCDYTGTIIVVSHDRYLINKVCNRLIVFEEDGVKVYDCGYTEYEELSAAKQRDVGTSRTSSKQKNKSYVSDSKEAARRQHRIAFLENKITQIEGEIAALRAECERPEVACDYKRVIEIDNDIAVLEGRLEPFLSEWESLSAQ